jgi:uncharacterized protein (UPF0332 family)
LSPREFLETAEELAVGEREADWRSAVSRAYYAAFHLGRLVLGRCGFAVPDSDVCHPFVWMRLANSGRPDIRDAGETLNELRRQRNRADYDLDRSFLQPQAQQRVWEAIDVFDLPEACLSAPDVLAQITAAVRGYERDVLKQVTWKS